MACETVGSEAFLPDREFHPAEVPAGVDSRAFMMRSAVIGAAA